MIPLDHPSYRIADSRLNLVDVLAAEWVQQDRAMSLRTRAATTSWLSRLRRLRASIASLSRQALDGDCFYLISGAMVALDLVLVIALVRS